MDRRHIAVFTPLATGHVYPALGVCCELVRRGHRVTYPANEAFACRIRETGAEAVQFKSIEIKYPNKVLNHSWSDHSAYWRATASIYGPLLITKATAAVAELEEFYTANPPDLILYEWFSFAGRILARHLSCPAVQLHAHFAHLNWVIREDGVCTTPEPMIEFARLLDSFMDICGFEGKGHLWHAENLNIILIPREFQFDAENFDSRFEFVGTPLSRYPQEGAAWKYTMQKEAPLVLISEASTTTDSSFLSTCIEAFAKSRYRVIFSKGSNSPEILSATLPHNLEVNRTAFNCEILPFCDVMLCQGGMGTTLESLHHGVPVVAMPSSPFNSEVAYRVAELGLGVHVPEQIITPRNLREAVDAVCLDEKMHSRARLMQHRLRSNRPAESAANVIEDVLHGL